MSADVTKRFVLPIDALRPHPDNPRGPVDPSTLEDLVASIKSQGILQAILATPDGTIVAGHRRHAAAQLAGLTHVPVDVRPIAPDVQLELMLVENVQREDLNPLQEGLAYRRMIEAGNTQADVARRIGVGLQRVRTALSVTKLAPEVQELVAKRELPVIAVNALVKVADWAQQRKLAVMVARRAIAATDLEKVVRDAEVKLTASSLEATYREQFAEGGRAPKPTKLRASRADLVAAVEARGPETLAFADLAAVVGEVCCACGMGGIEAICQSCPLSQLLERLLASREAAHAA